ncbi:hypothetical protein C0132_22250 [Priestia aryabhattai]|uniref:hypothetical protein n=1 Tax=Priestia aryabhattai TaxID=412384 RepID=UPI00374828CE
MGKYLNVEDVAALLEITPSALTKYYLLFEKYNYRFHRNYQRKLMFSEDDVKLLRKLIFLKNAPEFTVEKAVIKVLEENVGDAGNLGIQIQLLIEENKKLEQLIHYQNEIINMQQKQQGMIEELYNLHKKSLFKLETFIKQEKTFR